ncbi:MAG: hypothetical protein BIFFINMI_00981 [Phycisphaerae bacterium]|nr:hypothetical protein [Phycisphaerae bacterium]
MMRTAQSRPRPARAFTLLELLVVIAIMALLVALTVGASKEIIKMANEKRTKTMLNSVRNSMVEYKSVWNAWPQASDTGGLVSLLRSVDQGPSIDSVLSATNSWNGSAIVDAWGHTVTYYYNSGPSELQTHYNEQGQTPLLASPGPDGAWGGGDDIIVP